MGQIVVIQAGRFRSALSPLDRRAIEKQIEELIALLDAFDGDPDLEPEDDVSADDQGEEPDYCPTLPIYGVDQTLGPINARQAMIAYQRSMLREEFR